MDASDRWSRTTLHISRELLRPGLNRLTLHWPAPREKGEAALASAVERLEQGLAADLHPVFGEVFLPRRPQGLVESEPRYRDSAEILPVGVWATRRRASACQMGRKAQNAT